MALAATTIWEVQTGGSDTLNGGAFDPGQTAGMFTDGAATVATSAAPVFTSASYNFVAGDVGAWLFIASGTNWIAGWYKIASVAANAATLIATAGLGVKLTSMALTTATGCATTASPTGATWSLDYSQQAAAQFTYTDLATAGTGLTVSSALKPFAKQQVGNAIVVTGGTNFTTGRYVIASVSGTTATVVGATNISTGAGASGTGGQGGALASIGQASATGANSLTWLFIKSGGYTITSASAAVAGGCWSGNGSTANIRVVGYGTTRSDLGTAPIFTASGISTFTVFGTGGGGVVYENLTVDCASLAAGKAFANIADTNHYQCIALNCAGLAFTLGFAVACRASGCSNSGGAFSNVYTVACVASANTCPGFVNGMHVGSFAVNNTGASSDGFQISSSAFASQNCVAYGNGRDGFRFSSGSRMLCVGGLAVSNTGVGFNASSGGVNLVRCAHYNNTGGAVTPGTGNIATGVVTLTGDPFTNAAGTDFSLNATAGAGAACRAVGYPGAVNGLSTTGYLDIGAAQHADPAALLPKSRIFTGC